MAGKKSPFVPLHVQGKDGAATPEDLNRVQQQITNAFKKVKTDGGVTQLTAKDGSVILTPKSGAGAVDLSIFDDGNSPGSVTLGLGAVGPDGISSTTPTTFFKVVKDGTIYMIPAWAWVKPSPGAPFPTAGLVGWWKGDAGVTTSGSTASAWADQSGNNYDLAAEGSAPKFTDPGGGVVPYVDFDTVSSSAMKSTSLPWSHGARSVLVVCTANASTASGRLIDWNYSSENKYIWAVSAGGGTVKYYYEDDDASVGPVNGLTTGALSYILLTIGSGTISFYQATGVPSFTSPVNTLSAIDPGTSTGIRIGGLPSFSQNSRAQVREAAVWDHVLDSTERTQLAAYLASRSY